MPREPRASVTVRRIDRLDSPAVTDEKTAKQVIVMRKDLNMRKGKMIAQGAHASLKVLLDRGRLDGPTATIALTDAMAAWVGGRFTKVCVSVTSQAELDAVYARAVAAGVPCAMVI